MAHKALPISFFSQPESTLRHLRENGVVYLQFLWERVGEGVSPEPAMPFLGFGCEWAGTTQGFEVCFVTFPAPAAITEAYFVALAYRKPRGLIFRKPAAQRFFTLEYGASGLGGPAADAGRTVLCEWTADGSHLNFGTGPEPMLQAFSRTVGEALAKAGAA